MLVIWTVAAIVFLIIEGVTVGLASIWFAIGSVCALLLAIFHQPLWLQITAFVVVSAATLALTRPLVSRYINGRRHATNADRVIGSECIVTERIDNISGTGAVTVAGKQWTARSKSGNVIEAGSHATALRIDGVKLIVEPITSITERKE